MKFLILGIALFAIQGHATPFTCELPANSAVIENTVMKLVLSEDGKEVVQTTKLWPSHDKLQVISDASANGVRVIRGNVVANAELSCPGSCPVSTFELTIQPGTENQLSPNGELVIQTVAFIEGRGPLVVSPRVSFFNCN